MLPGAMNMCKIIDILIAPLHGDFESGNGSDG